MKELFTVPKNKPFRYGGSIETGIILYFGTDRKKSVTQQECKCLIKHFRGKSVPAGRSFNNPPPGSLGEWLINNVTKTAIASYVAPILVEEGYAKWVGSKEIQFY